MTINENSSNKKKQKNKKPKKKKQPNKMYVNDFDKMCFFQGGTSN